MTPNRCHHAYSTSPILRPKYVSFFLYKGTLIQENDFTVCEIIVKRKVTLDARANYPLLKRLVILLLRSILANPVNESSHVCKPNKMFLG